MKTIIILLTVTMLFLIISFFGILLTPYYYYCMAIFPFILINYLTVYVIFSIHAKKYPKNSFKNYNVSNILDAVENIENEKIITFYNKNGIWFCDKVNLKMDLIGFLFPKSFIRAYVIRNLRYEVISNKKPLIKLFKKKLFVGNKTNIYIKFIIDNSIKKIRIVTNGISKNSFLSKEITISRYYKIFSSMRMINRYLNVITEINEKIYREE